MRVAAGNHAVRQPEELVELLGLEARLTGQAEDLGW